MRYLKAFVFLIFFFLVMLFFVQNQEELGQNMILRIDLLIMPPVESISLPFYFLLLSAFLVGGLCALIMLIWDRIGISARMMMQNRQFKGLEKDKARAAGMHDKTKEELEATRARLKEAEDKVSETEAELVKAKDAIVRSRAGGAGLVSFDNNA
jgi:cell division protein FtsW (lipid II flippase)